MSIKILGRFTVLLVIILLQACATSAQKTAGMRNLMELNRNDLALLEAEKQLADDIQGVMENMNVGVLRRLNKDYKGSNEAFQLAKEKIEELYSTSITEQAGSLMFNDETISFQGDKFEQVLVHQYMAANYLNMGQLDDARVELLQSQVKMDEWGEPKDETPFMRYFSGIMFEMLGEDDSATVSYRKTLNAYKNTKEKHGLNPPEQLKYDLLRMLAKAKRWNEYEQYRKQFGFKKTKQPDTRGKGELIIVFGNGMAPQRDQMNFRTWSTELSLNIKVAVPHYPNPPVILNRPRLKVANKYYALETVSNIDGLARAALAEDMPLITARAIARAVIKRKAEKKVGKDGNALGQLFMMVINHGTEIADTRCWNTLPQEFDLARVYLPAGKHEVDIEVVGPMGNVVDTIKRVVNIKAGAKTVVSKRWISPEPKVVPIQPIGGQVTMQKVNATKS